MPVIPEEEVLPMVFMGHAHHPPHQPYNWVFLGLQLMIPSEQQLDARYNEEAAEHVGHPVEGSQESGPHCDENGPQDQSSHNPPEKDPVLVSRRYSKIGENDGKDEDIVHA